MEVHGNHYGEDLGYRPADVLKTLPTTEWKPPGSAACFRPSRTSPAPAAPRGNERSTTCAANWISPAGIKAGYVLVVPGAVGRPKAYDPYEFDRSVATLRLAADRFKNSGVRMAIEPIRSAEVSFCPTPFQTRFATSRRHDHPAVQHINGDVFHMQARRGQHRGSHRSGRRAPC